MACETGPSDTQFLTNIYRMEATSRECISEIRSLLSCPSKITTVRNLSGNEAQTFVDFLDQVLSLSCIDDKLRQQGLRLLSKICRVRRIIPASYILHQEPVRVGSIQYRSGFAYVCNGEYLGRPVAVKHLQAKGLKMNEGKSDRIFKRLCREIIAWKHLSHPNILPLLGVSITTHSRCFRILTEWMFNGNIIQYAQSNPEANRLRMLSEVMCGVAYLHDLNMVHGDLKGANILVDNAGAARVADFGLMTMTNQSTTLFSETVSSGGTLFWMSPELLNPPRFGFNGRPTCESDCYALGMVVYEVLTGLQPFHHRFACTAMLAILGGERPERPPDAESLGFSDTLWGLAQSCWSESTSARPTAQRLFEYLSPASLGWVPPAIYPVIRVNAFGVVGSDSSGFFRTSLASSAYDIEGMVW